MGQFSKLSVVINGMHFADRDSPAFQIALQNAHRKNESFCQCKSPASIALVVKKYRQDEQHHYFGLARWPDTGLSHDPDCHFFGESDEDDTSDVPQEDEAKPAFEDIGNGKSRVYLETSLKIIARNMQAIAERNARTSPAPEKRHRASEVALLLKVWRSAGLNVIKGRSRTWYQTTFAILRAASQIVINAQGETLDRYLLVGASKSDKLATDHNIKVLGQASTKYTRLFVIARLKSHDRAKQRMLLPLLDFQGLPRISVKLDQLDTLLSSSAFLRPALLTRQSNVVLIACVEPSTNGWWSTLNINGIATSANFLPIDSTADLAFEDYLITAGRTFLKPVVFHDHDAAASASFILLDTVPRTYCDVTDQNTTENAPEHATRAAAFAAKGKTYLQWSMAPGAALPELPTPHGAPQSGNLQTSVAV